MNAKTILAIFLFIISCIIPTVCIVRSVEFDQNCEGYIKQAADANTVELSLDRLNKAISYAEEHNLTKGYTSVLWKTEDENIGFWYENLAACRDELVLISEKEDATQLEKSNILMKVRESLIDNDGESGDTVTIPDGISRYPDNAAFGWFNFFSVILLCFSIGLFISGINEY